MRNEMMHLNICNYWPAIKIVTFCIIICVAVWFQNRRFLNGFFSYLWAIQDEYLVLNLTSIREHRLLHSNSCMMSLLSPFVPKHHSQPNATLIMSHEMPFVSDHTVLLKAIRIKWIRIMVFGFNRRWPVAVYRTI